MKKDNSQNLSDIQRMLILYDGQCFLCNRFIQRVFKRDKKDLIRAASLQDASGIRGLKLAEQASEMESVMLLDSSGNISQKSTAALRVLIATGNIVLFYKLMLLIPAFIRNFFYDLVARYRYRIWGKSETCILPSPVYRKRYLIGKEKIELFLKELNIELS